MIYVYVRGRPGARGHDAARWNRSFAAVAGWRCPRANVGSAEHDAAVTAFLRAAAGGNLSALLTALDPDMVLTSDGGGQVPAARRRVHGANRVARFVLGVNGEDRTG
jgi:hypothetical protein